MPEGGKPSLMIAALYEVPWQMADAREDVKITVCLGIRIGDPDSLVRLTKRLVHQVRDRYPEVFAGMKPKQIEEALRFVVLDTVPDTHGFPKHLGGIEWWQ